MKITPTAVLNSINFGNYAQKVLYAAHVLKAATLASPAVKLSAATPAVVGRRARASRPAIAAYAAQTAAENTAGIAAGVARPARAAIAAIPAGNGYAASAAIAAITESPAYPAGTAIPAYPAIPAIAAITEIVPVPAAAAVEVPAITPLAGYSDAITITEASGGVVEIAAYLPIASATGLIGSTLESIGEIAPSALVANNWVGAKAAVSATADIGTVPATLEKALLAWSELALAASTDAGSITTVNHAFGNNTMKAKFISIKLQRNGNYSANNPDLQLATVDYFGLAPNAN